jgi:RNA polymerase sigma-70 factor (ECF subfamily)
MFAATLERSAAKAFAARGASDAERDTYLSSLHLEDLALACACEHGDAAAWDHFVLEFRPILYRAADAIDPGGRAREAADALHGELFSRSLFRYFHGRSSLATWLRSLVTQRYVDHVRDTRRLDSLHDSEPVAEAPRSDPDRSRYMAAMQTALAAALATLEPRDRLRLRCYYAEEMTLAELGRITKEHEATVSRQLAKSRAALRADIERRLRDDHGFTAAEVAECITSLASDAGLLDLSQLLGERKKDVSVRSEYEDAS